MNEPIIKFTNRWNDYVEQYKKSVVRNNGEKVSVCIPHVSWQKTNEIVPEIDEWIRKGKGENEQNFTPETYLQRVIFMGMMSKNSDLFRGNEKR